jgi:hypothetical protein
MMNNSIITKISLILFMLFLVLNLGACSPKEASTRENPNVTVNENTQSSSLKIPDSYPKDVVPIYPNSHVYSVVTYEQSHTIMLYSKDDVSDVTKFYKNIFKNASNKMETELVDAYTFFGVMGNYTVVFDCGYDNELEGYQTLIVLSVNKNP